MLWALEGRGMSGGVACERRVRGGAGGATDSGDGRARKGKSRFGIINNHLRYSAVNYISVSSEQLYHKE